MVTLLAVLAYGHLSMSLPPASSGVLCRYVCIHTHACLPNIGNRWTYCIFCAQQWCPILTSFSFLVPDNRKGIWHVSWQCAWAQVYVRVRVCVCVCVCIHVCMCVCTMCVCVAACMCIVNSACCWYWHQLGNSIHCFFPPSTGFFWLYVECERQVSTKACQALLKQKLREDFFYM